MAEKIYRTETARLRLHPHQVGILQLLRTEGPMVQARLGDKLGVDKATIVPGVNDLEKQGLARRKNHPDDGRAFIVTLTSEGRQCMALVDKANARCETKLLKPLNRSEKKALYKLLKKLADHHLPHAIAAPSSEYD